MSEELKMPDAKKLADLLISQAWVEVDCQEAYDEFVNSLGCNLYDPSVQPAPGGEDVVLSAARTAPAEPVAWVNGDELDNMLDDRTAVIAGKMDGYRKTPLYTAPDALQAEVERLKADANEAEAELAEAMDILKGLSNWVGGNYRERILAIPARHGDKS
ncbi:MULTISPECIES: hypothetical protein [Pseudomonas]|uniref:hypothetical protein n=1 Tax=Pseudomonas TaxID=286 RepID=UPI002593E809|nr:MULTISPECIES: hypothetical protein [Pseudomonas]